MFNLFILSWEIEPWNFLTCTRSRILVCFGVNYNDKMESLLIVKYFFLSLIHLWAFCLCDYTHTILVRKPLLARFLRWLLFCFFLTGLRHIALAVGEISLTRIVSCDPLLSTCWNILFLAPWVLASRL